MDIPYYLSKYTLLHPEIFQSQLMAKFVQSKFVERGDNVSPFARAQVISFDSSGGSLENDNGEGSARSQNPNTREYYSIKARQGPVNPARSIRARLLEGDQFTKDDDLRVYWPLFPSMGSDPTTLEFVYVMYEDNDRHHGLWVSRVPGPLGEKTNLAAGVDPYKEAAKNGDQPLASTFGDGGTESKDYGTQEAVVGADPDQSNKSDMNYT